MKQFIENVKRLQTENEFQDAIKTAVLDIAKEKGYEEVESVLDSGILYAPDPLNRGFVEKIYKMLSRHYMTKRLIAKYSAN